jgi:Flp pilus assembly pilin Flp
MSGLLARARRLLADRRGAMLVEYSSLALLVALAGIALLSHWGVRPGD